MPDDGAAAPRSTALDRGSGMPLHRQIRDILAAELAADGAPTGAMTEKELMTRFRVSRPTIRQALNELVQDGLVYRERAKGTFPVPRLRVERPPTVKFGNLLGYLSDIGLDPSTEVEDIRRTVPPPDVAEALSLEAGETVFTYARRVIAQGDPVSWSRIYIRSPETFHPEKAALEAIGSGLALLEEQEGVVFARSNHHVWAKAASHEEAEALELPDGSPVQVIETIAYTREGRPGVWRHVVNRPEQIRHAFTSS